MFATTQHNAGSFVIILMWATRHVQDDSGIMVLLATCTAAPVAQHQSTSCRHESQLLQSLQWLQATPLAITLVATSCCLITRNLQDIDVESLMQEIRQWNPPEQAASAGHAQLPAGTDAPATVDASPSLEGSGLLPAASPAPSSSPDRTQSHAAASTSGSSHRVHGLFPKSNLELIVLVLNLWQPLCLIVIGLCRW